jgi:hypothetical protein
MPAGQLNLFPKDLIIQNAPKAHAFFSSLKSRSEEKWGSLSTHLVKQFMV